MQNISKDRQDLVDISSNRINENLYSVFNGKNTNTIRRWIWELIQNACDTSDTPISIVVKNDIKNGIVSFSHTGAAFDCDTLRALILQKSTKSEDDKKGGQFGTGFITTHLLSKKIHITGTFINKDKDHIPLDFYLDRSNWSESLGYKDATPIIKDHILKGLEELDKLDETPRLSSYAHLDNITTFTYVLDSFNGVYSTEQIDEDKTPVGQGIQDLEKNIPLLLSFNRKIKSIQINDIKYDCIPYGDEYKNEYFSISKVLINKNSEPLENIMLFKHLDEGFKIAVPFKNDRILQYPKNSSHIYCRFPLIGTENFGLPFIVNYETFQINESRDSLQAHQINVSVLDKAIKLYSSIIDFLIKNSYKNIYNLCYMVEQNSTDDLSKKYYNATKEIYCHKPIIETASGEMKSLNNVKVPLILHSDFIDEIKQEKNAQVKNQKIESNQKKFYDLMITYSKIDLPKYELCEVVYRIYKESYFSIKNMIELIEKNNRDSSPFYNSKIPHFEWLNNFIYLLQNVDRAIWKDRSIFINQKNQLVTLNKRYIDQIDEILKQVHTELLNETERESKAFEIILINKNIDLTNPIFHELIDKFDNNKTAVEITKIITTKLSQEKSNGNFKREDKLQKTYNKLFFWMLEHGEISKSIFPVLFEMRMDLCSNDEHINNYSARLEKENFLKEIDSDSLNAAKNKIIDLQKELSNMQEKIIGFEKSIEIDRNIDLTILNEYEKMEITKIFEYMAKLSIFSDRDLQQYLARSKQTPERIKAFLAYISTGLATYYEKVQEMLNLSERKVLDFLKLNGYNLDEKCKIAPTAYDGVKNKEGNNIILIIRPSNNKKVIFYYDSEPNFLRTNSELWIVDTEDPKDTPKQLTLGDILLFTQIKVIPLKNLFE